MKVYIDTTTGTSPQGGWGSTRKQSLCLSLSWTVIKPSVMTISNYMEDDSESQLEAASQPQSRKGISKATVQPQSRKKNEGTSKAGKFVKISCAKAWNAFAKDPFSSCMSLLALS